MSGIPFDQIRDGALAQALRLLRQWFPRGKVINREFKIGNLQGDDGDSLSINLATGLWKDFATDQGGFDLIDLRAAQKHAGYRVGAAVEIGQTLGIVTSTAKPNGHRKSAIPESGPGASSADDWDPIVPPPEGTPPPPDSMFAGFDVTYNHRRS